jgi:hypothetical protein
MEERGLNSVMLAPWFVATLVTVVVGLATAIICSWQSVNLMVRLLIVGLVFVGLASVIYRSMAMRVRQELEFIFGINLPENGAQRITYQEVVDQTIGQFALVVIDAHSRAEEIELKRRLFWRAYNCAWANGFIVRRWMGDYAVQYQEKLAA